MFSNPDVIYLDVFTLYNLEICWELLSQKSRWQRIGKVKMIF